ncbi:MAG: hypothetical protein INF43_00325 [Alphaproteobacteria bacterium]|nr:hypothetical protein [Alphaproteobacteria bacterium]
MSWIERLAHFYVNVVEPIAQVLLVLIVVILLLGIINFIRDPKAKENLIKTLINLIMKTLKLSLVTLGALLKGTLELLQKSIKVIFAAFRDFFSSKI